MKIAFDAKRIFHNFTGLGNYSRYVVNILATYYPESEIHLYSPSQGDRRFKEGLTKGASVKLVCPTGRSAHGVWKSVWRSFGIVNDLKKDAPQLFHGLSNELPFTLKKSGIKSVVTIHDLIFIRYPHFYPVIDRHIYKYKFKKACQDADKVIAISEMTKRDIISYFHIDPEKIKVVYQGCSHSFLKEADAERKSEIRRRYSLPERYVLYVGSIEDRKNLLLVVKALALIDEKINLIVIGKQTRYYQTVVQYIQSHGLEDRVTFLRNVPSEDLPVIYQQASLFTYPSFFEGFGIPIIEALHSGVPVIAATGSCLEEAGGPHSIYVDPTSEVEMCEAIKRVLHNPELANSMIAHGKEYVKRFADENIARDIMETYKEVLDK